MPLFDIFSCSEGVIITSCRTQVEVANKNNKEKLFECTSQVALN